MCIKPIKVKHPTYRTYMTAPCGQCIECRLKKVREWCIRLSHEARYYKYNSFVTLTYSPENLPKNGTLVKEDLQKFFKRLRKKYSFRYYGVGEYGGKFNRPHYHAIIFGEDFNGKNRGDIDEVWKFGHTHSGLVSGRSIAYVSGYSVGKSTGRLAQFYVERGIIPEFALMSRRPGLGYRYFRDYIEGTKKDYVVVDGRKVWLPRYYSEKQKQTMTDLELDRRRTNIAIEQDNQKYDMYQQYLNSENSKEKIWNYYIYEAMKQREMNKIQRSGKKVRSVL